MLVKCIKEKPESSIISISERLVKDKIYKVLNTRNANLESPGKDEYLINTKPHALWFQSSYFEEI